MSDHPPVEDPVIAGGYALVGSASTEAPATFYQPGDNPFLPIVAPDSRGTVHGLDFGSGRLYLVEVIHSEPGTIRGNHVHRRCTEIFTVLAGELSLYLPCAGPGASLAEGLLERRVTAGTTVVIPPGVPHTVYARTSSDSIAVFRDGDPRDDRDRVTLLEFPDSG